MGTEFKGRREDDRLLKGEGCYSADWDLPGQLHAAFLRSDRAHAEIRSLDARPALALPGVRAVLLDGDPDIAALKTPGTNVNYPGRDGMQLKLPPRPCLARGRVRFVGEPVALVVADSPQLAQDAAEAIGVEYEDLPAVVDAAEALAAGAPRLHDNVPGNLCFDFEWGDERAVNEAFARAAHVVRVEHQSQRLAPNPLEPKALLAAYDAAKDLYEVWSATQGVTMLRASFSGFTGLAPEKFRIHAQDVGGGFGARSPAYPEYVALLVAAKRLGRPVKWIASRAECFVSDYHGRAIRVSGELALDRDGTFLALRHRLTADMGAYLSAAGPFISTAYPRMASTGVYRTRAVHGRTLCALTNTTPIAAYRGAGRPDIAFLIERLAEQAARATGIDRLELRRRNFIPKEAFPYRTPGESTYDSGDYAGLVEKARAHSGWDSFEARRSEARSRGKLRGIGCAVFLEPAAGGRGPNPDQAMLKFGPSGEMLLYGVSGPSGQGHETVFPEIAARVLGVAPERITLRTGDPDAPQLTGMGTVGSRSTVQHGGAAHAAAREAIRKGLELAAQELEVAPQDIEYARGGFTVKGTDRSVALADLARRHPGALDSIGDMKFSLTFPSGAHVAEVEIDPETGATAVVGYVAVEDCGNVINHTLLEGQMHGGIAQGAGQVLGEQCVYDRANGQLLTASFMDYALPRADTLPEPKSVDHPVPSPTNALGVKGAGEAGTIGALPTLVNAILDALRPAGVEHFEMPATPHRIWHALRKARS
jgi:carbon-monoxide dehydrogenase large subunit